jgi:hypothetical protein
VESDSAAAGQGDGRGISPSLLEALAGLDAEAQDAITQVIVLHREFPAWAVWLPYRGRPWIAVRPASARAPDPELPMIWAEAQTVEELADKIRRVNAQLADP